MVKKTGASRPWSQVAPALQFRSQGVSYQWKASVSTSAQVLPPAGRHRLPLVKSTFARAWAEYMLVERSPYSMRSREPPRT